MPDARRLDLDQLLRPGLVLAAFRETDGANRWTASGVLGAASRKADQPVSPFAPLGARPPGVRRLVAYRLAFGQPRQQELLELVHGADVSVERLDEWTLDLAPVGTP